MKRVLFVAYFFPPLANSGTQRPLKFANYLRDFGWDPLVLTVDHPPDCRVEPALLSEVNPALRVTRVRLAGDRLGPSISWRLRKYFDVPDGYALWRTTAVRAARRLFREVGFDAVWATGYPWTSLLVGRDVSRMTGTPLVADFRDPWTQEDVFEVQTVKKQWSRHRRLEQSVLSQAAAVVGLAGGVTEELRSLTPNAGEKHFATISNGFDRADLDRAEPFTLGKRGRVRVVYTGVWKDGYGLDTLYEAIRALDAAATITPESLEVIAAGFAPGAAARFGVEKYVTELGPIRHLAALGLMRSADALFLPVAAGKREQMHLPGKLYEYAATGRPIIAAANAAGEVSTFLARVGGGIVIPPRDVPALMAVLSLLASGALAFPSQRADALNQHERKFLTQELSKVLYKVTGLPGHGLQN